MIYRFVFILARHISLHENINQPFKQYAYLDIVAKYNEIPWLSNIRAHSLMHSNVKS